MLPLRAVRVIVRIVHVVVDQQYDMMIRQIVDAAGELVGLVMVQLSVREEALAFLLVRCHKP
jgi:hypothetical protein